MKIEGCFNGVSVVSMITERSQGEFQRTFKGVSSCKGVSRKIDLCSKRPSKVIQGTFKGI